MASFKKARGRADSVPAAVYYSAKKFGCAPHIIPSA